MFISKVGRPYIVAGPCSVESRGQLEAITQELMTMPQVGLIRAGVWKPRTRPGGFEGLGRIALEWMQELAEQYKVNYCCEVASPTHVELCMQYGIQTVWIGARTTANPFMIGELCRALKGTNMSVMVKNPVCPDARLWIGAIERLAEVGISDVAAVHRGFNMYNNRGYRNAPMWEVAMEFRRECPNVPILCDPSHMGGQRSLIASIAFNAVQLAYDGLMIEVHPNPEQAWSDAPQQLSPAELQSLLSTTMPQHPLPRKDYPQLLPLREQIDEIDHELLSLLSQRMAISKRISSIKDELKIPVYQSSRWAEVMDDRLRFANDIGLNGEFTRDIMEKIHAESVRVQLKD